MGAIEVTALYTYPFKSCAGVALERSRVTVRGLELDRSFMLVDDRDDFVSQRKVPELALVVPRVHEDAVLLSAPGMPDVRVPLRAAPDDARSLTATVHDRPVLGQLVGEELDEWFTSFLPAYKRNERFRLLRLREDAPRPIKDLYRRPGASNQVGFADGSSLLLASERSLAQLNLAMREPVPMNRFRPNIVVDGDGLVPYEEDWWARLRIGALEAFVVKACDRCVTTDVDQASAVTGKAVRRALAARRGVNAHDESNKGVFFAQNLNHVYAPGASVAVGERVHVLERAAQPNVRIGAR